MRRIKKLNIKRTDRRTFLVHGFTLTFRQGFTRGLYLLDVGGGFFWAAQWVPEYRHWGLSKLFEEGGVLKIEAMSSDWSWPTVEELLERMYTGLGRGHIVTR